VDVDDWRGHCIEKWPAENLIKMQRNHEVRLIRGECVGSLSTIDVQRLQIPRAMPLRQITDGSKADAVTRHDVEHCPNTTHEARQREVKAKRDAKRYAGPPYTVPCLLPKTSSLRSEATRNHHETDAVAHSRKQDFQCWQATEAFEMEQSNPTRLSRYPIGWLAVQT